MAAWSSMEPSGHIWSVTICNLACEIISRFVTSYYKLTYFLYAEICERKTGYLISCIMYKCHTHDFKTLLKNILEFDPQQRQKIFPLASVSRPALRTTQPPAQCVLGVLSWGYSTAGVCH
jgi:hypothetical protein